VLAQTLSIREDPFFPFPLESVGVGLLFSFFRIYIFYPIVSIERDKRASPFQSFTAFLEFSSAELFFFFFPFMLLDALSKDLDFSP